MSSFHVASRGTKIRHWTLWIISGASSLLIAGAVWFYVHIQPSVQSDRSGPYFSQSPIPLKQGTQVGLLFAPYGDQPSGGQGMPVDAIAADRTDQDAYHTHVHLSLYVNGKQAAVPAGIGIVPPWIGSPNVFIDGGRAMYWLHTHDNTGIIHIESPGRRNFTLGNFFDIWGVKLSQNQFLNIRTKVTTFVNGILYKGDPTTIELTPHKQITLELGAPIVLPEKYAWPASLLKTETVH